MWLFGIVLLCACAAGPWQKAPATLTTSRFSIAVPDGWMRLAMADYEMFSRDGTHLHYIFVQERALDKSFRFTRKRIEPRMLPHEVAEIVLDDLKADPQIRNFKVLGNEPVEVGGVMGFRLTYTYMDPLGLETQSEYYGALLPDRFFNLRYTAARRHYFDKYRDVFDYMYHTLRLRSAS